MREDINGFTEAFLACGLFCVVGFTLAIAAGLGAIAGSAGSPEFKLLLWILVPVIPIAAIIIFFIVPRASQQQNVQSTPAVVQS